MQVSAGAFNEDLPLPVLRDFAFMLRLVDCRQLIGAFGGAGGFAPVPLGMAESGLDIARKRLVADYADPRRGTRP